MTKIISVLLLCFGVCATGFPQRHISKILIIGNSIVQHDPSPAIGWTSNWGMAASVADSDFVHLLAQKFRAVNSASVVQWKNIASFERQYKTYDLSQLKSYREFGADMVIVKLSENVNDSSAVPDDFKSHYKELLDYLDPGKKAIRIIVDGFWPKPNVNRIVREVATAGGYPFVSITALFGDDSNTAKGLFAHEGVAKHPFDKGMRMIAEKIFEVTLPFLR